MTTVRNSDDDALVCRAGRSAFVVFGFIFGLLTLMAGIAAGTDRSMGAVFAGCTVIWALSYLWLARFKIILSDQSIEYRILFGGTRRLDLEQIKNIHIESGVREDRFKPFVRLATMPETGVAGDPMNVNLKVLGATSVRRLLDTLQVHYQETRQPQVVKHL